MTNAPIDKLVARLVAAFEHIREDRITERQRQIDVHPARLGVRAHERSQHLAVRARLALIAELLACLEHLLETAGNPSLMTTELKATLADHAAGNYRVLMNLADELLMTAVDRELPRLDEKLYLEAFGQPAPKKAAVGKKRSP